MSKAEVISVLNHKGGVGKTTTTINLGGADVYKRQDEEIANVETSSRNAIGFNVLSNAAETRAIPTTPDVYKRQSTYRLQAFSLGMGCRHFRDRKGAINGLPHYGRTHVYTCLLYTSRCV